MSDEREKPATDPSGMETELRKYRDHLYANEDNEAVDVLDEALALIQSQRQEIDSLLDGMREIAEEKFRTVGELRAIATRHIVGAGE